MTPAQDTHKQTQIVQNLFSKSVQIITDARLLSEEPRPPGTTSASASVPGSVASTAQSASMSSTGTQATPSNANKWFNLELKEPDFLSDVMRPWKQIDPDSLPPPLVIDCYLDPSKLRPGQTVVLGDHRNSTNSEVVLERWIIEFKPPTAASIDLTAVEDLPVLYKRAIVSMRSLYTVAHLLPAWQLRQRLTKQKLISVALNLGIKIHNGAHPISSKGRIGLSKSIDGSRSSLQQYKLQPLDTPIGTLHCGVTYRDDVHFQVEDVEKIMAQKFMDLDSPHISRMTSAAASPTSYSGSPTSYPIPNQNRTRSVPPMGSQTAPTVVPGSVPSRPSPVQTRKLSTGATASSSSLGPRPILSFTRPFKSNDDASAIQGTGQPSSVNSDSYGGALPAVGTPLSGQVAPQSIAGSVSSVVSTASSRFSSSFASQRVPSLAPRSYSNDSHRLSSVAPQSSHGSHGGSQVDATSKLYMAQADIGDFVRFVDETSRRGPDRIMPPQQASSSEAEATLARYQNMRSSHMQLTDSIYQGLPNSQSNSLYAAPRSLHQQLHNQQLHQNTSQHSSSLSQHSSEIEHSQLNYQSQLSSHSALSSHGGDSQHHHHHHQHHRHHHQHINEELSNQRSPPATQPDLDLTSESPSQETLRASQNHLHPWRRTSHSQHSQHSHVEGSQPALPEDAEYHGFEDETVKPSRRKSSGPRSRLGFYADEDNDDAGDDSDMLFALSDMHI